MSKEGKSKHQLWQELCVLISKNPEKVSVLVWTVIVMCCGVCVCVCVRVCVCAGDIDKGGAYHPRWTETVH